MSDDFEAWNRGRLQREEALRRAALELLDFSGAGTVRVPLDDHHDRWVMAGPASLLGIADED